MGILGDMFNITSGISRAATNASMTTGNAIYTALQNARTKKEIRNIYKNAADANYTNRSVTIVSSVNRNQLLLVSNEPDDNDVYDLDTKSPTPALDFIWGESDDPEGEIVSGGDLRTRTDALIPFVHKSQQDGLPLIVLHNSNNDLISMIRKHSVGLENVARSDFYYDVFRGLPEDDIVYLLYESLPEKSSNPNAESLLRALVSVIIHKHGTISIKELATFPITRLKDELDSLHNSNAISYEDYKDLERYYMAGSSELDNVRIFLNRLNRQAESIFGVPSSKKCNIKRMLNCKGVISINVGSVNNDLVVDLILNHLMLLQSQGREFSILIDDVPIAKHLKIRDILRGRTYAISQQDFISSLHGGEINGDELFSELTGSISSIVLFHHSSGASCQKWSDYMGKYKKIRIRYNISQSTAFMNSSDSRGISVDETDEPRIRAETISKLSGCLACIYRADGILLAEVRE